MKKLVSLFVAGLVTLAMSFIGCSAESGGGRSVKTPDAPVIKAVTITNGVDTYTAGATKTPALSVTVEKPTDGADLFYSWMYSKVAISISGTSVDVSGLFADGTTVYNWYDGTSATVSGGKVTFAGGTTSAPILVSEKNPANCGVTF